MNQRLSIQLKALFLLIVFASNTAVGFACSLGVDMDFNTSHHNTAEEATEVHVHADGKKHDHGQEQTNVNAHDDSTKHHHAIETAGQHQDDKNALEKNQGGCCSDEIQKFQNLDKNLNQNVNPGIDVPVFVAILNTFLGVDLSQEIKDFPTKYKARFFYPPPPDIRIAIQSFQI
ncbi:hypothetical protein CAP36_11915 [Chitinophagaceae bacterium IBVUCB2]|nr:hypothetical protein CAP36_11915 [Chitinophagaceae bacterium IBVUCB2]